MCVHKKGTMFEFCPRALKVKMHKLEDFIRKWVMEVEEKQTSMIIPPKTFVDIVVRTKFIGENNDIEKAIKHIQNLWCSTILKPSSPSSHLKLKHVEIQ